MKIERVAHKSVGLNYKWKGFSLLEMMVTLVLYGIVLVAVFGMIDMEIRLMGRMSSGGSPVLIVRMLSRMIEGIVRDSYEMRMEGSAVLCRTERGWDYRIGFGRGYWIVEKYHANILIDEKRFSFSELNDSLLEIRSAGRVRALYYRIRSKTAYSERLVFSGFKSNAK